MSCDTVVANELWHCCRKWAICCLRAWTLLQVLAVHTDRQPSGHLAAVTRGNSPTFVVCRLTNWVIQNHLNCRLMMYKRAIEQHVLEVNERLLTYLLTYLLHMQSPSWAANWFAASQEIPRISRNPKVHYRTHKRPLSVSILGQPNPVHIPTSHLLKIHPNIIHPSTPRSPQWYKLEIMAIKWQILMIG